MLNNGNVTIPLRGEGDIYYVKKTLELILTDNDKGLPPFSFGRHTHRFEFSAQYGDTPNSELLHASIPAYLISGFFINPISQTLIVQPNQFEVSDDNIDLNIEKYFAN